MADNDLIVVIPGIMGSTLCRNGTELWSSNLPTMLAALATLGKNIRELELSDGIGDDAPDDGVEGAALMPSLHVVPGLWSPIRGYEQLVRRLQTVCTRIGNNQPPDCRTLNPIVFPYDWRLSNRYSARQLKIYAESALGRWRDCAPQNRDAEIIFVCHSMGGLVARWYMSYEGGASITRKLVTLGTPYRGSMKALAVLADGPIPMLGRFGESLHRTVLSFPSLHQLLPSYACVERGAGLEYLIDQPDSPLPSAVRRDAASFYGDLEVAEAADPTSAPKRHVIVGVRQPTTASASLLNGRYVLSDLLGDRDLAGDGTVSAASIPKGLPIDDNSIRRIADKHGNLQCTDAALDEIESVVSSARIVVKGVDAMELTVAAPELISAREGFSATITWPGRRTVIVTLRDEGGRVVERLDKVIRREAVDYTTAALEPGGYTLEVRGAVASQSNGAVISPFLVWPDV